MDPTEIEAETNDAPLSLRDSLDQAFESSVEAPSPSLSRPSSKTRRPPKLRSACETRLGDSPRRPRSRQSP